MPRSKEKQSQLQPYRRNQCCSTCPNDAKKRTGPGGRDLVFAHDGLQYVKQWVGSDTPELSLSVNATSPRETAEDQDSFCRSHLKVDEQFKQLARCEVNVHE